MYSVYLIVHVGADVLAFFFDETRKLLELGFLFCHAGHYTMLRARHEGSGFGGDEIGRR
jgi:hypothetical protein